MSGRIKKTLAVIAAASLMMGCAAKNAPQNAKEITPAATAPYRESPAPTPYHETAYTPSAADLQALLAVFPVITAFPITIEDAPVIEFPSLVKSERALDPVLASRILDWEPPPEQWRPEGWRDAPQTEEPAPSSGSDEEPLPLGDSGYSGDWERGFYAMCQIQRPGFLVLIAAYSEAVSSTYSNPWVKESYQYRLVTLTPEGRYIDSIVLHGRVAETYHPGSDAEGQAVDGPEGPAILDADLSLRIERGGEIEARGKTFVSRYAIDQKGKIREVGE